MSQMSDLCTVFAKPSTVPVTGVGHKKQDTICNSAGIHDVKWVDLGILKNDSIRTFYCNQILTY